MKLPVPEMEDPEINVASLIDMVFLLLVYFMATASLVKSEADLGIRLPGMLAQARTVDLPDEQILEVREGGHVILNGREYDDPNSSDLPALAATLVRYRLSSTAAGNEPMITIQADDNARQQRVIDVMNACAVAGIKGVTFGLSGD
ncbi:MAG: biopolymer transporter ExbD [Kiritimatiellia bacterium]